MNIPTVFTYRDLLAVADAAEEQAMESAQDMHAANENNDNEAFEAAYAAFNRACERAKAFRLVAAEHVAKFSTAVELAAISTSHEVSHDPH